MAGDPFDLELAAAATAVPERDALDVYLLVNFVNAENRLLGTMPSRIDGIAADDTHYFGDQMKLLTDHAV